MVDVITVNIQGDLDRMDRVLSRIRRKVPESTSEALNEWGTILERDMKNSAIQAGIKPFTGTLFTKGIEWRMKPKGRIGRLFIRQYGVFLDSMRPHAVAFKKSRTRLLAWGLQARSLGVRVQAALVDEGIQKSAAIFVRPHPFIRRGFRRARPKLRPIARKHLDRAVRR